MIHEQLPERFSFGEVALFVKKSKKGQPLLKQSITCGNLRCT